MAETTSRVLQLLGLLQSRRVWTGEELAERLGVTTRSVRRDVERLRDLGYPVHASKGHGGGYQLGAGAALPPLDRHLLWASTFSPAEKAALYSPDFAEHIELDQARQLLARLLPLSAHPLDQAFAVDLGLWVPEVLTVTLGIDGIQVRTPFLDHRIVELAASLPPSWKVGWGTPFSKRLAQPGYGCTASPHAKCPAAARPSSSSSAMVSAARRSWPS